jgi:hypothetical protein
VNVAFGSSEVKNLSQVGGLKWLAVDLVLETTGGLWVLVLPFLTDGDRSGL